MASALTRVDWTHALARHPVVAAPVATPLVQNFFLKRKLALRDSIVHLALAQVGTPYVFGGTSPEHGFDCSGLVRYVFSHVFLVPPRTARQQARIGTAIDRDALLPGDLLAFGLDDTVSHVGIYIGDGRFVHASSVAGHVVVSRVDRPPAKLIRPLTGARRLLWVGRRPAHAQRILATADAARPTHPRARRAPGNRAR